jgi:hypothetical protein
VPQYINATVVPSQLEVAMVWRKPPVEDVDHVHRSLAEEEAPRRFLRPVAGIALHPNANG